MQTRTKTDAIDATVLAQFAQRMPFVPWQRPDDLALAIRACARRITALNKLRTQTKNQLHATEQTATTPDFLIADLQQSSTQLDAQIESLRQRARDLIAPDEQLQHDRQAKQWVATAGLDPREHRSAPASTKNRACLSPATATCTWPFTCQLSAPHVHDPNVRAYYHHLIDDRGLKKLPALCAVMRKLLLAIHAMLKTQTPFDSSRFYSPSETTA